MIERQRIDIQKDQLTIEWQSNLLYIMQRSNKSPIFFDWANFTFDSSSVYWLSVKPLSGTIFCLLICRYFVIVPKNVISGIQSLLERNILMIFIQTIKFQMNLLNEIEFTNYKERHERYQHKTENGYQFS